MYIVYLKLVGTLKPIFTSYPIIQSSKVFCLKLKILIIIELIEFSFLVKPFIGPGMVLSHFILISKFGFRFFSYLPYSFEYIAPSR